MSFQNKHVFRLVLTLAFSSCFSSFLDYEFKVYPVKKCPMNKEGWDLSSIRMNCNKTHGYHCVPNKFLTSLIEFCYPRGDKIPFQEGNCLELADTGILNHVPCNKTFSSGCPDSFYFGNEIYKYPKCLEINTTLRCFEADTDCIKSRQNITTEWNSTDDRPANVTQNILENSTALVEGSTVKRNGTAEQTESSTKTHLENIVIIILSILLAVSLICLFLKKKLCSLMHIKHRRRRNYTLNKKMKIEMEDVDYCTPHYISSESDTHNYNKCNHVSAEETNRAWTPFVPERESSSQSDPQSFSSPSNDERDSFYKDMCGRNEFASSEDSSQSDPQSFSSQFQEQINQGYVNDEYQSVPKRMPKSRKNTSGSFLLDKSRPAHQMCTSSNPSPMVMHCVPICFPHHYGFQCNSMQSNHQKFPYNIPACIIAQLGPNTDLPEKVAATTNLSGAINIEKGATNTFGTEKGSTLLKEDDTDNSECDIDILNLKIQANANDLHLCQTEYLDIDNPACYQKPRTVEMDIYKSESVTKKKASKQTKEEAFVEQAKSITSSNFEKKSEQKEKKKEFFSFDKIKEERKKERLRQREHRMTKEEWRRQSEIEQEKIRQRKVYLKQGAEFIRLAREKEEIRKDREQLEKEKFELSLERGRLEREREKKRRLEQVREKERSNAQNDLSDSYLQKRSDERDKKNSKRRRARTSLMDSPSELISEKDMCIYQENKPTEMKTVTWNGQQEWGRQGGNDINNVVVETNFSRKNCQEMKSISRDMSQFGNTCYPFPDNLVSAPNSQTNWESSSDSGEVESSLFASIQQIDSRSLDNQPQDSWTGGSLGLQAVTRQQESSTPESSGPFEAGVQNMLLTSVPQAAGMVLTNTSMTKRQNPDLMHSGACRLSLDDTEC